MHGRAPKPQLEAQRRDRERERAKPHPCSATGRSYASERGGPIADRPLQATGTNDLVPHAAGDTRGAKGSAITRR